MCSARSWGASGRRRPLVRAAAISAWRPIDQHVKGFESLGAKVSVVSGYVRCDASESGLKAANIYMDVVTVGATINIMLAAVKARGRR